MKRFGPIFGLLLVLSMVSSGAAQAKDEKTPDKLDYHVSDAFIQAFDTPHKQVGSVASASSSGGFTGDQVRVTGNGDFHLNGMKASGGGTFVHTSAAGLVRGFGTWTATGLQSFVSYGCDTGPFPPNFCGGKAVLNVHIDGTSTDMAIGHTEHDGLLTVNCLVGPTPSGMEGIMLNIPGVVNFDTTLESEHGETLFVSKGKDG